MTSLLDLCAHCKTPRDIHTEYEQKCLYQPSEFLVARCLHCDAHVNYARAYSSRAGPGGVQQFRCSYCTYVHPWE